MRALRRAWIRWDWKRVVWFGGEGWEKGDGRFLRFEVNLVVL